MSAWLTVKDELKEAAVEVDQKFLQENPDATASAIKKLLDLTDLEADRLRQAFRFDHPERTSIDRNSDKDIANMEWGEAQHAGYEAICVPIMRLYGYSSDAAYYASGYEENGLVWVQSDANK